MLLNCCYCPYFRTILKYVHHFANIALSFSVGEVSIHHNQQLSLEEAIPLADAKMYEIKKEKKHSI